MHLPSLVLGGPTVLASRLNLAAIVFIGGLDVVAVRIFAAAGTRSGKDRRTFQLIQVVQLAAVLGGLVIADRLPGAHLPGSPYAWVGAGLGFMIGGALLRAWAIATLGQRFRRVVTIDPDHEVVSSGPYRWLRHPAYAGAIASLLGLGLALDNVLALAVLAVLPVTAYLVRIRVEEAALAEGLGEDYTSFAVRRKRLVPYVY